MQRVEEHVEPVEAEVRKEQRTVRITWSDQHVSVYPLQYLRGYCPCATCQGHGGAWLYVEVAPCDLATISEVGSYALGLGWSDGHKTGLYSYELLRRLCPCDACRSRMGQEHPMSRMVEHRRTEPPQGH